VIDRREEVQGEQRRGRRQGAEQSPGARFKNRFIAYSVSEALEVDLAGAYPEAAGCRSWRRRVALDRAAPAVVVTERWDVAEPGDVRLHHVVAGEPVSNTAGELVVRSLAGARLRLRWAPGAGQGRLERRAVDDPILRESWGPAVHRLVVTPPPAATGSFELRIDRAP